MGTDTEASAARARLNADVVRVAAGDRAALQRVYDATSAKLFGICLRISGDREAAEDALQDTFLKVWRRANRFDAARASAITWLCLLARGTAIDARRVTMRTAAGMGAVAEHALVEGQAPEIDALALENCLSLLDDGQQQFIRSAYFDGYSYAELAQQAAMPLATMKSRIRRGLLALRRCLDDA
ncbi:sigma-70 family RNA polymerase sigma factor [Sphingomonas donggukensis]|uniref:Sigma-70 family RNA polymerase sigma factor n=1 Tax=Sphingomonas donggukensis TaxID=2949093 RepID=A0ABY4TS44_9SPHN|nr:sigma-70 family RNA polymerase sigma factor [Sphingomonas donggukensis]URW74650.1 sigma-70 family RNA polymerase sigma factor [Sphingomonas donggukensis]